MGRVYKIFGGQFMKEFLAKLLSCLYMILLILIFILSSVSTFFTILNPPTVDDLTVDERIKYERMIFP